MWQGNTAKGYGRFWLEGQSVPAHRAAYVLFVGPITDGLFVLHNCDTPLCVRPDHLRLGTQSDNIKEAFAKGRKHAPAIGVPGEQNGNSSLTEEQVLEIRSKYKPSRAGHPSTTSFNALAREYGVSKFAIQYAVKHGWRHLRDSRMV